VGLTSWPLWYWVPSGYWIWAHKRAPPAANRRRAAQTPALHRCWRKLRFIV